MQMSTYIRDLLFRYECVIIPGFGALLSRHESARIDSQTNTFYPPGKSLSFNRQLQTNDGLLANHLASSEQCEYELALQKVRNFVGRLSLKLAEGESVEFQQLGSFSMNQEKAIQFVPDESMNFSTASFGLASFVSPTIDRSVEEHEEVTSEPLLFEPTTRTARPYLKYVAVGLIAVIASGFGGLKWYEGQVEQHNFAQRQEASGMVDSTIQVATFVFDEMLPVTDVAIERNTGRYHIVAGAFRIRENADRKVDELWTAGYHARYIGENRYGLHQVVYNSYENRGEALRELRKIKSSHNKDAWMLVQNLNP
ncbi:SPOR domain-containing protein [Aureitalea marina]|uniref:Sporulation protein n=1 Tax=Aureitalea marina TaxID=930804 RepID=A0A2S7KSB1_9FLAO|nr:SPOR domain-containing protein [Aureitalea marina]PQB05519.1 sporulation protein [Aureitalea marina]